MGSEKSASKYAFSTEAVLRPGNGHFKLLMAFVKRFYILN